MDRPLKLLLAVLGIAGTLAFLVSTGMPAPKEEPVDVPATATTPVPAPPAEEINNAQFEVAPITEPQEPFKFGEPTIDGKPYGEIAGDSSNDEASSERMPVAQVAPQQTDVPVNPPGAPSVESATPVN